MPHENGWKFVCLLKNVEIFSLLQILKSVKNFGWYDSWKSMVYFLIFHNYQPFNWVNLFMFFSKILWNWLTWIQCQPTRSTWAPWASRNTYACAGNSRPKHWGDCQLMADMRIEIEFFKPAQCLGCPHGVHKTFGVTPRPEIMRFKNMMFHTGYFVLLIFI